MQDRRQVLRTTAAGTGLALVTGRAPAALARRVTESAGSYALETGFQAETTGGSLVIDGDSPTGESSLTGRLGLDPGTVGTTELSGKIYDDGTWEATNVSVPDPTDLLAGVDLTTPIERIVEELSVTGLVDALDLDQIIRVVANLVDGLALTESDIDTVVETVLDLVGRFDLGVPESFVENGLRNFLQDPDPSEVRSLLELVGITSIEDILDLAGVRNLEQLEVILRGYFADIDVEQLLGETSIDAFLEAAVFDVGVTGLSGQFDREQGFVTASPGELTLAVGFQGNDFVDAALPLDITLTTGESGALTGSTDALATDTGTARLVNNEFVLGLDALNLDDADLGTIVSRLLDTLDIDLGGIDIGSILSELNLDGLLTNVDLGRALEVLLTDKPGRHFLAVDVAFDFDAAPVIPGTITGQTTDDDGDPVPGATISVFDSGTGELVETTVSGNNGVYSVRLPAGEYEVVADAATHQQATDHVSLWGGQRLSSNATLAPGPPALPGLAPPRDRDGDGLYEHVRGESEFSILDVQTLFDNLDSGAVQRHARFYNFSNTDPSRVTVLDVQALFDRLRQ